MPAPGRRKKRFPGSRTRRTLVLGLPFLLLLLLAALCALPRGSSRPSSGSGPAGGERAALLPGVPETRNRVKVRPGGGASSWRLADEKGRPLGGLPLLIWTRGEAYPARTDPEGRFSPPSGSGGGAGTWWSLEAELPGGAHVRRLIRASLPPGTIPIRRDFRSLEGILAGPRGEPVLMEALELPDKRKLSSFLPEKDGRWTCLVPASVPPGALLLRARGREGRFLGAWFPAERKERPLRLDAGLRPLRILFPGAPPPAGARILAAPRYSSDPALKEIPAGGKREVDLSLPPGPWQVVLLDPGGRLLAEDRVRAGADPVLRLQAASPAGALLEGRVLDPRGKAARGARVVLFPTGLLGRKRPLPAREDWNPFLAARIQRETLTGKDGSFRLLTGPWSGGILQVSSDRPSGGRRTLALAPPWRLPGPVRLREAAALEIRDLRFPKGRERAILEGELEILLERKGGPGRLETRILCLPWRSPSLEPGRWILRLEGGGLRGRLEREIAPGRILRLEPLLD